MLSLLILNCLGSAYFLEAWLRSSAAIEYAELFGIQWFYIPDYIELRNNGYTSTYIEFLNEYHDSFFVRLISCATCLSFWLGLATAVIVAVTTLNIYCLLLTSPVAFLNLFLYRVLNKLV